MLSRPSAARIKLWRWPCRRMSACVSDEDFWRLCQENPDLRLERTAQGELIVIAPEHPMEVSETRA